MARSDYATNNLVLSRREHAIDQMARKARAVLVS